MCGMLRFTVSSQDASGYLAQLDKYPLEHLVLRHIHPCLTQSFLWHQKGLFFEEQHEGCSVSVTKHAQL